MRDRRNHSIRGSRENDPGRGRNRGLGCLGREGIQGVRGGSALGQEPSWFLLFVTGGKAASVGTDTGRGADLVMTGCGSSILIDDRRQGHLMREMRKAREKRDGADNRARVWERELTGKKKQGRRPSWGHIGG